MDTELYAKIDEIVEEMRTELYQKASYWGKARTPSEFFDFEQKLQTTLNTLQAKIVGVILEEIHQDMDFVIECRKQALYQRKAYTKKKWCPISIRTLSGEQVRIRTPYALVRKEPDSEQRKEERQQEGAGIYPVLRRLGIVKRVTPRLLAEANRQFADGPSGVEAEDRLANREIALTQKIMRRSIRDFTSIALLQRQMTANNLDQVNPVESIPLAGKRVVVGIDGGRLRIRINKKTHSQTKTRDFTVVNCEPKLFAIYTIDPKGNKERGEEIIYDGTIQSADRIFTLLKLRLKQLGITKAELLVIIGDGIGWIWNRVDELQMGLGLQKIQVVEIVDWAHAVGKLSKPAKLGIKEHTKQQKWFKRMRRLLKKGKVDEVIVSLLKLDRSQDKEDDIRKVIEYFQTHKTRMQYARFRDEGLPLGSGVIESGVRRIVNLRMKGSSIFWTPENAEAVLHLRCQIKSGQWVTFVKSVLSEWANDMTLSLPQAHQIREQIATQFLESHPPVYVDSRSEIIKWADNLLEDSDTLIVDTETTGLEDNDEIIQLAIVDLDDSVLFETLLKPTTPVSSKARTVHGITDQDLANAPTFLDLYDTIANLVRNRHLVAYNADFDRRLLMQTCEKYELPKFEVAGWDCVMEKYACFWRKRDANNNFIRQRLTAACTQQGITINGTHEAVKDCLLTVKLIKAMAIADNEKE